MVSTRSKDGANEESSAAGTKRKEHATNATPEHDAKAAKKQITLDEMPGIDGADNSHTSPAKDDTNDETMKEDSDQDQIAEAQDGKEKDNDTSTSQEKGAEASPAKDAVKESAEREKNLASNILEKGIVYFFTRNRVGVEDAESVGDLQRTYFVLRPLNQGAQLGDGAIPDTNSNRLLALPKKTFPKSHSDRFMAFVEKSQITMHELKDQFFKGSEYETQTAGTRRVEPITPIGEGVYMITRTEDRTTHLAYAMTIPSELGEVQDDIGLRSWGSFVISVKNPERPGPASARLPQAPKFPKEIIENFRGLAWAEVKPEHLNYENCQILLIGGNEEKATEPTTKDKKHEKATPKSEIEQLEHEDELRVEHLHGNDSIFDDLEISKKEYPKVPTTW